MLEAYPSRFQLAAQAEAIDGISNWIGHFKEKTS